tara:strand:+ start:6794 stop:8131 length:1338 start_codon:yes stop_codon:yes gene_type:complete
MAGEYHSPYGGSSAKQFRLCPGSIGATLDAVAQGKLPAEAEAEDEEWTKQGTRAHDFAKQVLLEEIPIEDVDEELREPVEWYVDHCLETVAEDSQSYVETNVPLFYRIEEDGTVDWASVHLSADLITITDLKFGMGEWVEALENDQLATYALGLVSQIEFELGEELPDHTTMRLQIYQPRHYRFDGEATTWETDLRDLKDFGIDLEAGYQKAKHQEENPEEREFNPSQQACQFCKIKGICRARALTTLGALPDNINPIEPLSLTLGKSQKPTLEKEMKLIQGQKATLTDAEIGAIVATASELKKTVDAICNQQWAFLKSGGESATTKLIEGGLKNRAWTDAAAAETFLKGQLPTAEVYGTRKIISPPAAAKKIDIEGLSKRGQNRWGVLVHRAPGAPKLVPFDAPGEAINQGSVEDEFETIPGASVEDEFNEIAVSPEGDDCEFI